MNANSPSPEIWVLQLSPRTQNVDFLKKGYNDDFDYISVLYGCKILKQK
jgi:hypothetical protein